MLDDHLIQLINHPLCPPALLAALKGEPTIDVMEHVFRAIEGRELLGLPDGGIKWHVLRDSRTDLWRTGCETVHNGVTVEFAPIFAPTLHTALVKLALAQLDWQLRRRLAELNFPTDLRGMCARAAEVLGLESVELRVSYLSTGVRAKLYCSDIYASTWEHTEADGDVDTWLRSKIARWVIVQQVQIVKEAP